MTFSADVHRDRPNVPRLLITVVNRFSMTVPVTIKHEKGDRMMQGISYAAP